MSREIKFRVWNKERQLFVIYGETPKQIQDDAVKSMELPIITSEDCVWQQYTGLKDKNGQEIYEGDLLVKQSVSRTVYLVDFNNENYGWMMGWNLLEYGIIDDNGYCSELDKVTGINNPEIMNYPVKSYYYGSSPDDTYEVMGTIFEGITSEKL